jgi:hypothetical protein
LTCIRVGNKQKKIDISIPKLDTFVHKVYINAARKIYSNVYLFEKNISPLQIQKNNRELELIIQECILVAIRDSIPTESIIRAYMDESMEQEEEIIIENIEDPDVPETTNKSDESIIKTESSILLEDNLPEIVPSIKNIDEEDVITRLTFDNTDRVMDENNIIKTIEAPKNIERLEEISTSRAIQRKLEEDDDDDDDRIKISSDMIDLSGFDVLDEPYLNPKDDILLNDVEELV